MSGKGAGDAVDGGKGSSKQHPLMMSLGKDSASDVLDNLEINLDEADHAAGQPDSAVPGNEELQISEIRMDNQPSSGRHIGADGEDEMAEMEKLLKSGGAFGGNKNLSNTFKKIRGEIAAENEDGFGDDVGDNLVGEQHEIDSKHQVESL